MLHAHTQHQIQKSNQNPIFRFKTVNQTTEASETQTQSQIHVADSKSTTLTSEQSMDKIINY